MYIQIYIYQLYKRNFAFNSENPISSVFPVSTLLPNVNR